MRRLCFAFALVVFVQMLLPQRAEAWFGWLDELSGPGKFYGAQVDLRLACFGAREPVPLVVVGAIRLSLCPLAVDADRLFSVDFGARFFWTTDNPSPNDPDPRAFADGHPIFLVTVVPSISYRPIYQFVRSHDGWVKNLDVVDVGAGYGAYRFMSKGLEDFSGDLAEYRFDFHLPSSYVRQLTNKHQILGRLIPQVRYARVGFLDGFQANAFNPVLQDPTAKLPAVIDPTKDKSKAIKGPDWVGSWVFFIETHFGK
jgi:hypothetical protein